MQGKSIIFVIGGIGLVDGFFPLLLCLAWIIAKCLRYVCVYARKERLLW